MTVPHPDWLSPEAEAALSRLAGPPSPRLSRWWQSQGEKLKAAVLRRHLTDSQRAAREAMQRAPLDLGLDLVSRKLNLSPRDPIGGNEVAQAVATTLREGIQLQWRELRSIELVLQEVAEEFDGESPTRPWEREALDDGKKRLEELHRAAQAYVGPFKLPGPDKEEMEQVREVIRREGEPWR